MVYTAALATVLFYAANVPLCMAFFIRLGEDMHFGIGIAPFEGRFALKSALRNPLKLRSKAPLPHPPMHFTLQIGAELLRRTNLLDLHARIGTGDAALTALLCGLAESLAAFFKKSDILPIFEKPYLELSGIIEIRAGNIIRAMAMAGIQHIRQKIPSKG